MKWKPLPSLEVLSAIVRYEPDTGLFYWIEWNRSQRQGGIAGSPRKGGYLSIKVNGQNIQMHRVAWLFMTGQDPRELQIDHRDGVKSNNRWKNLRPATPQFNSQNMREPSRRNRSGFLGVSLDKRCGLYRATIKVDKCQKCLGYYARAEDASAAYVAAKRRLHPGCTI